MNLEERAEQAARNARCTRCHTRLYDNTAGMLVGSYRPVGVRQSVAFQLCGRDAVELREFLNPELADDPDWQKIKAEILGGTDGDRVSGLQDGARAQG